MRQNSSDFDTYTGLLWLARLIDSHTAETRRDTERLCRKYDPNQPRVPRGNSDGGQWTDGGADGNATSPTTPLPRRKPYLTPEILATARAINRRAPAGLPPEDLEVDPRFGVPRWYVEGAVSRVGSPLSDAATVTGLRGSGAVVSRGYQELRHIYYSGVIRSLRKMPAGVSDTGKGLQGLSAARQKNFKSFRQRNTVSKNSMEVRHYSDETATFSFKRPARNIPGSYAEWEKHVDSAGNMIRTTKTTYAPDGKIIHVKPK